MWSPWLALHSLTVHKKVQGIAFVIRVFPSTSLHASVICCLRKSVVCIPRLYVHPVMRSGHTRKHVEIFCGKWKSDRQQFNKSRRSFLMLISVDSESPFSSLQISAHQKWSNSGLYFFQYKHYIYWCIRLLWCLVGVHLNNICIHGQGTRKEFNI